MFHLDSDLVKAAHSPVIREALMKKVSRERVYKECEGMMNHSHSRPCLSFLLMHWFVNTALFYLICFLSFCLCCLLLDSFVNYPS
jgi:hypothetical protein